ncbi:hypothetical protein [Gordonia sp. CPCC 205333]|uniref:hypothetical protein n=1 Tax=Gordonia sp. CPCC 205333 TaxID=3140790 RepID=UPI003AF3DF04
MKFIGGTLDGESRPTGHGYTGHVDLVGSKIAPAALSFEVCRDLVESSRLARP